MNRGEQLRKRRRARQTAKRILMATVLLMLAVVAVGSTIAYIVSATKPVINSFERAEMSCEVTEVFDGKIKQNVAIKNTTPDMVAGYIRAVVMIRWEDEFGNVYAKTPAEGVHYTISYGDGWEKGADGYYYWPAEVEAEKSTGYLIKECKPVEGKTPEGYTFVVDILAEIIQSNPKDAVTDAWGFVPGTEGEG